MAVSIMTLIDFYKAVAANEITDEVIAKAEALIAKDAMDKAKAAAKRAEKSDETAALEQKILGVLCGSPMTASDIVAALGEDAINPKSGEALKPQWVSTHLRQFVADGVVEKSEIKGEKGKVVGYAKAAPKTNDAAGEEIAD